MRGSFPAVGCHAPPFFSRGFGFMVRRLQHVHTGLMGGTVGMPGGGRGRAAWRQGGVEKFFLEGNKSRLPYHGAFLIDSVDGGSVSGSRLIPW